MNPDGSDVRRLTTNPELDRQPDWSPGGTEIAYTIRKPGERVNFELSRMTAAGRSHRRLTTTVAGQASSQGAWFPNGRGLLFRRSGAGRVASIWQLDRRGENPLLRFQPPNPPLYPTFSPDMSKISFAAIMSPTGDTDRGVFVVNADGSGLTALFDVPGSYDSAPA
jgi:TolB protein